jgi:phenylacetate-coenzyme A ligase PaaK-like adenylate-forming protein
LKSWSARWAATRGCSLRTGVFGAEPWTGDAREIERRLGITALDIYGLSEVMGPGVAMECIETAMARPSGKTISSRKWSTG